MSMLMVLGRNQPEQALFNLQRGFAGGYPGPVSHAEYMCIHGDSRMAKGSIEDNIGRFPADARQRLECHPVIGYPAAVFVGQQLARCNDIFGFAVEQADGADLRDQSSNPEFQDLRGCTGNGIEFLSGFVNADIGCLGRQDNGYQ